MKLEKVLQSKGKLSMVTCYDYTFAKIINQSRVDIVLVGDSLANVILGDIDTRKVKVSQMVSHTVAVCRGAPDKPVIADMPYLGCQTKKSRPLEAGFKFLTAGACGVKVEWFQGCQKVIKELTKNKIPVMGHIGFTPQTAHLLGKTKIQGKTRESQEALIVQAQKLQDLGVFCLVLECVSSQAAKLITKKLKIPTIGIGSGHFCRGQVLVLYDLLGIYPVKMRFARAFADLSGQVKEAVDCFDSEVKKGFFPSGKESY